ncbi:hypothetical protein QJS66_22080 [Kocuria rhizophila]|nr:hypothetical protein QJS66_22080 [Kocuria rhizophila]
MITYADDGRLRPPRPRGHPPDHPRAVEAAAASTTPRTPRGRAPDLGIESEVDPTDTRPQAVIHGPRGQARRHGRARHADRALQDLDDPSYTMSNGVPQTMTPRRPSGCSEGTGDERQAPAPAPPPGGQLLRPRTGSTDEAPAGPRSAPPRGPWTAWHPSTHDTSAERTSGVGSDAETVAHGDTAETVAARERREWRRRR